jgi:hypothetical protein
MTADEIRKRDATIPALAAALRSRKGFIREDSERIRGHGNAWMSLDVISFVIGWRASGRYIILERA